jgi:hypothetical protein
VRRHAALNVEAEEDGYVLMSTDLDDLEDAAEVWAVAEERLATLVGILLIQNRAARSVAVSGVMQGRTHYLVLAETAEMRVRFGRPPPDDEARTWLNAARDPHGPAARALRAFRRGTGADLYTVLEIIAADLGGGIDEIARRGWAPARELQRFKHAIQFYESAGDEARHGNPKGAPPPDRLPMREARRTVRRVLESWLDYGSASP